MYIKCNLKFKKIRYLIICAFTLIKSMFVLNSAI